MNKIDLTLKKHDEKGTLTCKLYKAIEENNITIVLGAPGSGKTTILEKFYEENKSKSKFLKIDRFLKLEEKLEEKKEILLLDGLDEFRSVDAEKSFILTRLGYKISKLNNIKIVISCREMDWYGETDTKALKDEIKKDVHVYNVLPLNLKQQKELAKILDVEKKDEFIEKFTDLGFLDNPQMFYMLTKVYEKEEKIETKYDLYRLFIKEAKEKNTTNIINKVNIIEDNLFFKIVGYISFFYIFSGVKEFGENFIDNICNRKEGYERENIEKVLKSSLFNQNRFIHRTLAEFSLANYINSYLLEEKNKLSIERIKTLFIKNNRVPTELRGTYAWLCSLTRSEKLISYDPYYQAIHGDNSLFDDKLKQTILLKIKEYSKKNPWFFGFGEKIDLEGFYNKNLDDFLIKEFEEAIELNNHYQVLIIEIFNSAKKVTKRIENFLKEKVFLEDVRNIVKADILELFQEDINFLKKVLFEIENKRVLDKNDDLKEKILSVLYPRIIDKEQISKYLSLYGEKVIGHCKYLYKTEYSDKFDLVDNLYKFKYYKKIRSKLSHNDNIKSFIDDYFLETILEYNKSLSAKDIYKIIKHFKQYYEDYREIKFNSYRYELEDKLQISENILIELANELYSLYIDDVVQENEFQVYLWNFKHFFNYKNPDKRSEILFSKMNKALKAETNRSIFFEALSYAKRDEGNKIIETKELLEKVQDYGLEEDFFNWKNPKKSQWQIEDEKIIKEKKEKEKSIRKKNEEHFKSMSDEEIQKNFGSLHYVAQNLYIESSTKKERYLKPQTLDRLKNILKKAIISEPIDPELLTLKSLAKNSFSARRNIDTMYYVSATLNKEYAKIKNIEFKKYLFIVYMMHKHIVNIAQGSFLDDLKIIDEVFVKDTIKEYFILLLDEYGFKYKDAILPYIKKCDDIEKLEELIYIALPDGKSVCDGLIDNFLKVFNFDISLLVLNELLEIETNEENRYLISALKILSENRREDFTISMAIAIQSIFEHKKKRIVEAKSSIKIKIIDFMLNQFKTEASIENHNGWQSGKDITASFLRIEALEILSLEELKGLGKNYTSKDNIWTYRIANKISELESSKADSLHSLYSIEELKSVIFENKIISNEDFFTEISLRLDDLKDEIEDNRYNGKKPFYNENKTSKNEEACRDEILRRLKDKYQDINLTKEQHEADNRVDLNIKYNENSEFEIQIECKKDNNADIYKGIQEQLIGKYLSSKVKYGVYIIFYFGDRKDKEKFLKKVYATRPIEQKNFVKILCIDLT